MRLRNIPGAKAAITGSSYDYVIESGSKEEDYEKVKNIISEHKGVFDKIVEALETKHLLSREELLKMVA